MWEAAEEASVIGGHAPVLIKICSLLYCSDPFS